MPSSVRRRWLIAAVAVAVGGTLVMLLPVLAAPVNADDRYWYLRAGPMSGGSYWGVLTWTWEELPEAASSGRLAPLASVSRRLQQLAVMQVAVSTATPVVVLQAIAKVLTFALLVAALIAFLRSLRARTVDGTPVGLAPRTLGFIAVAGSLLIAAGSQAHTQFRNGWTSYSVLTWGAVVVVFGIVALTLWLVRRCTERPALLVPACVAMVVAAAFLNLSYELVYVTAPAVLLSLLLQPAGLPGRERAGRRAKLVLGGVFLTAFSALFVGIRWRLSGLCEPGECYEGVQPQFTLGALRTMVYNLVGAVPVAGGNELRADLERVGLGERWPVSPSGWSILLAVVLAVAVMLAWWALEGPRAQAASASSPDASSQTSPDPAPSGLARARRAILVKAATIAGAVAVGEAVVMGVSVQAEEVITQAGLPYRHTMITWTGIAIAVVCLVMAITTDVGDPDRADRETASGAGDVTALSEERPGAPTMRVRGSRLGYAGAAVLAALIAYGAAVVLPANAAATTANRLDPRLQASEEVQWAVVLGDRDATADERRCDLLDRLYRVMGEGATTDSIAGNAEEAMRFHHDQAFCSSRP